MYMPNVGIFGKRLFTDIVSIIKENKFPQSFWFKSTEKKINGSRVSGFLNIRWILIEIVKCLVFISSRSVSVPNKFKPRPKNRNSTCDLSPIHAICCSILLAPSYSGRCIALRINWEIGREKKRKRPIKGFSGASWYLVGIYLVQFIKCWCFLPSAILRKKSPTWPYSLNSIAGN